MGKKSNIIYKKLFGIRKQPQLIKGLNVGYEITELKKHKQIKFNYSLFHRENSSKNSKFKF